MDVAASEFKVEGGYQFYGEDSAPIPYQELIAVYKVRLSCRGPCPEMYRGLARVLLLPGTDCRNSVGERCVELSDRVCSSVGPEWHQRLT
eukprot:1664147-Rhodomonas_salina.1